MYLLGRDVVLRTQRIYLLLLPLCYTAAVFPIPRADMSSVPGEQVSEADVSSWPCTDRGAYQVFGKRRRDCSLDVFFPLRVFVDTVCLVFCCAIASADNFTVTMSILSLLLVLIFLMLLAQESSTLSQILTLVINHSPLVYIVVIIVGINLCVTKLLLYTTVAAAAPP
jgi:hypothetical protein